MWQFCQFNNETSEAKSVFLQSYLNMLRVLQVSSDNGQLPMRFKVKVKAVEDEDVVQKVSSNFFASFLECIIVYCILCLTFSKQSKGVIWPKLF